MWWILAITLWVGNPPIHKEFLVSQQDCIEFGDEYRNTIPSIPFTIECFPTEDAWWEENFGDI